MYNYNMISLYGSLLDDFDTISSKISIEDEIKQFLENNYYIRFEECCDIIYKNDEIIVNVNNDLIPKKKIIKQITNDLFKFGEVAGDVDFTYCDLIKTLKGCPKKVYGFFDCGKMDSLISLEGSPEFISGNFYCVSCPKLKSLKGGPKQIDGSAYFKDCGKKFTENDVKKANIKVNDEIYFEMYL